MPRPSNQNAKALPSSPPARVPVEYVTAKEAAAYLGLGLPTLNAMRHVGLGPAYIRVSPRRVVYELVALREYMVSRTVQPSVGW